MSSKAYARVLARALCRFPALVSVRLLTPTITPKGGRVAVGPFMTDEKGGVVRMVHLMYRCNKRGIRRGEFQFTSNLMLGW